MVDNSLTVTGGTGGITAHYDDMLNYARGLDDVAQALLDRVPEVAAVAVNPDVLASAPLSPGTAARVEERVTAATIGPRGLVPSAAWMKATAVSLRAAVDVYRGVDTAQAQLISDFHAVAAVPVLLSAAASELPRVVWDTQTYNLPDLMRIPGLIVGDLKDTVYANPWIVDGLIDDSVSLMQALPPALGPAGTILICAWSEQQEGVPFPPRDLAQGTGVLIAGGERFGWFGKGEPEVTRLGKEMAPPPEMPRPTSVAGLLKGVDSIADTPGGVRVFAVIQPDGSKKWVVEIPGTQDWGKVAGKNPIDLTNNLRLMAGQDTVQNEDVRRAMRLAGIKHGEEVLLAGFSQGGITAASLAATPATRAEFTITNVVTAGSPVARFAIPPDVHVLSLEHTQDAVPRLDAQPNPDRPNWVTVKRDVSADVAKLAVEAETPGVLNPLKAHGTDIYASTRAQVDDSSDPSLVAWKAKNDAFFEGTSTVSRYQIQQVAP